jgi:hypothetical protein
VGRFHPTGAATGADDGCFTGHHPDLLGLLRPLRISVESFPLAHDLGHRRVVAAALLWLKDISPEAPNLPAAPGMGECHP